MLARENSQRGNEGPFQFGVFWAVFWPGQANLPKLRLTTAFAMIFARELCALAMVVPHRAVTVHRQPLAALKTLQAIE